MTWIPEEKIKEAARLFAKTKPACIQWGVAIEQLINCVDNNRIFIALAAVTGNLDVPGGTDHECQSVCGTPTAYL